MALDSTYDNNRQTPKRVTVNSPYSFANPMSTVDATKLSAAFWNRMLKLTITPRAATGNDEIVWDKNQYIAAHLTHVKAAMLAHEIREYLNDPISYNSSGVLSNKTLITISNGSEFGAIGNFIVIRNIKLDENDPTRMETVASYSYEFNSQFHHSIRNYNEETATFEKAFDDFDILEITELLALLDNYVAAITNAIAYTVVDQLDYRMNQTDDMIKSCAASLGVEVSNNRGTYKPNNTRRIPKSNSSSFSSTGGNASIQSLQDDIFG